MEETKFNNFFLWVSRKVKRSVDELSNWQFKKIALVSFSNRINTVKKLQVFGYLYRPRIKYLRFWLNINRMNESQVLELSDFARFMLDPKLQTVRCFVPRVLFFRGPEFFNKVTFGEFVQTADYLSLYTHSDYKPDLLNKLIASIYYPKGKRNFNDTDAFQRRAKLMKWVSAKKKLVIYYNYLLFMNYLAQHKKFNEVFKKSESKAKVKDVPLWIDLVDEWVGHDPERYQGKYDLPMMTVLYALNQMNKKNKKYGTKKTK